MRTYSRLLERGVFFWEAGGAEAGTLAGSYCEGCGGCEGRRSWSGATSITSLGTPRCTPCSRQVKSQVFWRICSTDSSRLDSVTQVSPSPNEQVSRMAKFLGIGALLRF